MQRPTGVLQGGLAGFGLPVHPPPAAHDTLDVLRGAGTADGQQALLRLGRGHAREGANLGVGQLAAGEGLSEPGQRGQGARHPHVLAGGTRCEPDAPGQPRGAGSEAGVPAAPGIELADEIEQARGGGVEVRGQLGDLVTQAIQLGGGRQRDGKARRINRHGDGPLVGRLYTANSRPPGRACDTRSMGHREFPRLGNRLRCVGPARPSRDLFGGDSRSPVLSPERTCQECKISDSSSPDGLDVGAPPLTRAPSPVPTSAVRSIGPSPRAGT